MRNIEIVELLLDKGAKVSAVDKVLFKHPHVMHAHAKEIWGKQCYFFLKIIL